MTREEAIKEIKSWDFLEGKEIEAIHTLIPELKESEDERIRRKMIEHFKAKTKDTWCNMPVKDIIAYLEKQKEQKPVEPSDDELQRYQDELHDFKLFATKQAKEHDISISFVHDFEWNNFCAELLSHFNEKQKSDSLTKYVYSKEDKRFIQDCANILVANDYTASAERLLSMFEQKPAEWSEEDVLNCNRIIRFLEPHKTFFPTKETKEEMQNWIKNRFKFLCPIKQEWSEEDEDMLNCCISSIEEAQENRYAYKETDGDTSYDREIDWLKSLRPHWKPSEEQN